VDAPVLTLLTLIIAALAGLGVIGLAWPRLGHASIGNATAGLAGLAALLALVVLLLNDTPATLALPLGLPGAGFSLVLDPPAALFAVLAFGAGAATSAFAGAASVTRSTDDPPPTVAAVPICLAGLGLAVLTAGGLARGSGLAIAGFALWTTGPAHQDAVASAGIASPPQDATALAGVAPASRASAALPGIALLAAAAVIAAPGAPPPVLLVAALLGPGALAGLVPLHAWLPAAHRASEPAAALLSGAVVPVAIYLIVRLLFDPAGAAPPMWWGLPFLGLGAASVVAGGLDATRHAELDTALAAGTVRQTGLTAIGIGIALTARAADLPAVTAMALGAVLLLATLQAICGTLLLLVAGAIRQGAGTRRLDRLGGLVHRMPITTACLLTGLFGLCALPPGPGFAATWLLFQALLSLPRAGGLPFQLLLCGLAAVLGLAAALAAASLLRLAGMACLGRPRTPRAAAADEPRRPARRPLLALAATTAVVGVFVGPLLRLLADAPILALTGTGLGPRASFLGLAPGAESPGYAALPLTSLLVLAVGLVLWLRRRRGGKTSTVSGPAWDDGFAAPPAWLPFGNPVTQTTGAGFTPFPPWRDWTPLRRLAPSRLAPSRLGPSHLGPSHLGPSSLTPSRLAPSHLAPSRLPRSRRISRLPVPPLAAPAVTLILVAALLALCGWAGAT